MGLGSCLASSSAPGGVGRGQNRLPGCGKGAQGPEHSPPADAWTQRWVESKHKPDYGRFVLTAGKFYGDAEKDKGEGTTGAVLCWVGTPWVGSPPHPNEPTSCRDPDKPGCPVLCHLLPL